ncbi:MAG: DEAD/DEAH box helicase [Psychromonas sp.]|nr:DEAD/DEAH box helicase [Psychromonas sp.]
MLGDAMGFSLPLLKALKVCNYKQFTPIQQQAIPLIIAGKDLLASAQTGTGKTAAFVLPILDMIFKNSLINNANNRTIKALILTPTRELALQIEKKIKNYSRFMPLTSCVITGGTKITTQQKNLKIGNDILVATPGRLIEHINARTVNLSNVKHLVLDEADRMLDIGFLTAVLSLLSVMKQKHQRIMFSATFSNHIRTLAKQILDTPKTIDISPQNSTSSDVKQQVYWVSEARKQALLSELIGVKNWRQVLVFAGTKETANLLAKELKLDGIKTVLCHGDKTQCARNKAIDQFSKGNVRVLVATDVAARGLDIADLPYVVNFHLPFLAEDYVHRIGRTGRAKKKGIAISLVSPKDEKFLGNIEALIGRKFDRIVYPGYEMDINSTLYNERQSLRVKKNSYKTRQEKNHVKRSIKKARHTTSVRRAKTKKSKPSLGS